MHIPFGSAALAGVGLHLPRALGRAQVWQAPPQAFSQQTPSTQKPLPHWSPLVQSWPSPRLPQLPPAQTAGAMHCMLLVQAVMQVPSSQVDGLHEMATPTIHMPSPSQTLGGTNFSRPSQAPSLQTVPAANLAQPP